MNKTQIAVAMLALSWGGSALWVNSARAGDEAPPPKAAAAKPGKVKLSHQARKVLSCEKVVEEETTCRPATREPAKSGAKVKLNPSEGDPNAAVSVELSDKVGEQASVVSVAPGNWELVWQGGMGTAAMRDKFFVQSGDEFDIALQTDIGVCRLKGEQCSLDTEKKQQSVEIPSERGL